MNYKEKYGYAPDQQEIDGALERISRNIESIITDELLKKCFSMMDLTTLNTHDTEQSVARLVDKVNAFKEAYPAYPLPASICVYSNFASVVAGRKNDADVHTTVVSACFPSSQSFLEVKLLEVKMAVEAGADEVDIVLSHSHFAAGDYDAAVAEIAAVRKTIDQAAAGRHVCLKVILETGIMKTAQEVADASFLAMEAGADFIKTSTGKVSVNATPQAAYVMCQCIKAFCEKTGRKIGFKPAGGMSTAQDAACYYTIVSTVLGREWLDKSLLRFGVSRMANNLLSALEQKTVSFF
ncbi:MAG: deoxyribose-phosphate aldolase [Bacteroidales bacterium]|nr:deoxyribose-phosphate aldolase [Bacteroidales bacterium]